MGWDGEACATVVSASDMEIRSSPAAVRGRRVAYWTIDAIAVRDTSRQLHADRISKADNKQCFCGAYVLANSGSQIRLSWDR